VSCCAVLSRFYNFLKEIDIFIGGGEKEGGSKILPQLSDEVREVSVALFCA
jgi:hypothetical protein